MADGPMSTPRRCVPRSMGTPIRPMRGVFRLGFMVRMYCSSFRLCKSQNVEALALEFVRWGFPAAENANRRRRREQFLQDLARRAAVQDHVFAVYFARIFEEMCREEREHLAVAGVHRQRERPGIVAGAFADFRTQPVKPFAAQRRNWNPFHVLALEYA